MILITGATGLVGSHIMFQLLEQNKKVKCLVRNASSFQIPNSKKHLVEIVEGDILDVISLEKAMMHVKQVYHCAAIVSFHPKEANQLFQTNIEGTANVVNACIDANIEKLCFISSVSALGRLRVGQEVDETMNWTEETSNSNYGKSKFLAEMEVWRGIGEGLKAVIVNPTIILGLSDWNKGSSKVFQTAYNEFPWYTDGVTGLVDVLDVANVSIQLMESDITSQRFIISAENIAYRKLFDLIATGFGKKKPFKKVTPILASIVWRLEAIKAFFTGKPPLLTKETSNTAQAKVYFNNKKLLQYLPQFQYTTIEETVDRLCKEYKEKYQLK